MKANKDTDATDYPFGKWLSKPEVGEEVVISGVAGRLPESRNIHEFRDNLFNKRDMATDDDRRWTLDHPEVPKRSPKIHEVNKLDAGFFGLHYRQANVMDPMMRKHLETAIEAVMDAGVNPAELEGTRTGVFLGACYADMETKTLMNFREPQNFGITGYLRSFLANRLSYYLKLKGPSVIVDTACSSSMNALELAFKSIRCGKCDNAIVGGVNILLDPGVTIQFYRLGLLSDDGTCKVFDQNADGYVRAEAVVSVFLQKAKNARRIYSKIVYTKVNSDGYKPQGITFPSTKMQQQLMTEIFKDSDLSPDDLSFLEAHGTGTEVGDPEEVEAIDLSIGQKRKEPLLIGAVKCSIGHSEPTSGLSSILKMILAFETGKIPPNIKLNNIKDSLTSVLEGRLKIVTEETDLDDEEANVGLNNFGFGGNNAHVVIRRFKKVKKTKTMKDSSLPRLVCVSGRTKEAVLTLLEDSERRPLDEEHVALLHNLFKKDIRTHLYRGYALISEQGLVKSSWKIAESRVPLYVFFGQIKSSYENLSNYLYNFPVFRHTIKSINDHLSNANLKTIEVNSKNEIEYGNEILGAIAVQTGIVNVIKALELDPVGVYGDSTGKLATAYYNEDVTLKEAVVAAFKSNRMNENNSEKDLKKLLPALKSPLVKRKYRHFFDQEDKLSEMENTPAEFFTFDSFRNIPKNAVIINVSDERLSKRNLSLVENGTVKILEVLGRLYEMGHNPQLHKLYPEIEFPVSRGTPMISPLIKWNYSKDWYTYRFTSFEKSNSKQMDHRIVPFSDEWKCISGHVVDGRNLIPASEYLRLVWYTFADNHSRTMDDLPVVFENCSFMKAVILPRDKVQSFTVNIYSKSGEFGLFDENSLLVSGRIFSPVDIKTFKSNLKPIVLDETDPALVLKHEEIYKELNLRGYNYAGMFKGVTKSNVEASSGLIEWENNWTSFIDKMFQMKILQTDTRLLYVPVGIKRLTIDPSEHRKSVKGAAKADFPVYVYKESNVIKSGGVEITGLVAKPISRKKSLAEPIIEKYEFVPNETQLVVEDSVKINLHIMLENTLDINFKAVEMADSSNTDYFMPLISQILEDIPFMKPDLTLFADSVPENITGVKVGYFTLNESSNLTLIVGKKILKQHRFEKMLTALNQNGFILTKEDADFIPEAVEGFNVLTQHVVQDGKLILLRKVRNIQITKFIKISSDDLDWLPPLQQAVRDEENVIIYTQNEELEGIMGLVNSIRREPGGDKVRCFFITHPAPEFDPRSEFYRNQIEKNFAINVYKDSKWGTYRHLLLEDPKEVECEQILANTIVRGDISSLRWFQGHLTTKTPLKAGQILVHNYYSALNFKDVLIASGRINIDIFVRERTDQDLWLGMEFSGRDTNDRRVVGMSNHSGLASLLVSDFVWEVPEEWSMEEAATVPVAYSTVIYTLFKVISLKPGSSILIHSATGGVGMAALNVCLYHKCEVFVTVGTEEKREFLKRHFSQIPDNHIGNSRDVNFEEMIKRETKGRGVDLILNSVIGEKLFTSIRCLRRGGDFLEIGKYDLVNDNRLRAMLLEKEISYHGISIDRLNDPAIKKWLISKICEGIKLGFVKPLPRIVFDKEELDKAFRHMTTGKHVGKVLVKIRDEEHSQTKPAVMMFKGLPRFSCYPDKCYIVVGGLGGFGLELTDWLVLRGARKVVLVTSTGLQKGYQSQRIRIWRSYGANIQISFSNVTTQEGCFQLLQEAAKLGPVDGIFNLAAVLRDSLFTNQTEDKFRISLAAKACSTKYLDKHSRILCPNLRHFVVFSSISCGRGNPGQSNYAMANSIMERICERRKKDGLPGLAIQWGAIGEVGLVASMQKGKEQLIGGTVPQKVSSCLEVLDRFLNQDNPVVSSMIIAKESKKDISGKSALDAIGVILGIKNIKSLDPNTTLVELGMDSITGTEIVNTLEKCYDINVTAKDVRSITLKRILELEVEKKEGIIEKKSNLENNLFIQYIPKGKINKSTIINIPSQVKENQKANTVIVFPGIEGVFELLEPVTKNLNAHVLGVQYGYDNPESSVPEIAKVLLPYVENNIGEDKSFRIIGYSFGVIVALEVVVLLEKKGYNGIFVAIEGSPLYQSASGKKLLPEENEDEFQTSLIFKLLSMALPIKFTDQHKEKFLKCKNFDKRLDLAFSMVPSEVSKYERIEKQAAVVLYKHFKAAINYTFDHEKIKTKVNLFKAKYPVISDIQEDYEFSEASQDVDVTTIDGDHVTILRQQQLSDDINRLLN